MILNVNAAECLSVTAGRKFLDKIDSLLATPFGEMICNNYELIDLKE